MNIEITKATLSDLPKANEFLTRLIQDEKHYDINVNEHCVIKDYYEHVYSHDDKCLLMAKNNNETIGYIYGYIIDTGNTVLNKVSRLDAIFVDEASRGQAVASKLIKEFKAWSLSQGCRYIEVGVYNANIGAKHLYQKQGFKEDRATMTLDLEDNK